MILGASADPPEANEKFRAKFGYPFPLLCDTDLTLAKAYGAAEEGKKTPSRAAAVIDAKGRIAKWWPKVDARTFPEQALATVSAAGK